MKYKALKDIATITMGQSPDSSSYNEEKNGIPFYQGNADFGELYPTTRVWCSKPKKIAKENDILISVRAPIGALNYATEECCIGRGLAAITIENDFERNYVFHFLKAQNKELNNKGTGSTFKAISKSILEEIQVPVISKEQQEISMKLMDIIEQIIRQRKQELQRLDDLIKSRFIEMFGDPVTNSKGLVTKKGSDFFTLTNGKFVPEGKRRGKGIPAYGGNGISWYTDEILVTHDTIVVGRVGFQSGNVHFATGPLWVTDNAMYISDFNKDQFDLRFLCALMERIDFTRFQDAGDLKKITQKPFMQMSFIAPSIQQQKSFITFIEQTDKSKFAVQKALDETQLLFNSLMQKYFG